MTHPAKKDYYGGALLMIVGGATAYASVSYHIGTLQSMGPGYFPCAIGVLMAVVGVLLAISAATTRAPQKAGGGGGHGHGGLPDPRGAVCIVLATVAFYFVGEYFGLLPATFAISFLSAIGDRDNSWKEALIVSVLMAVVAAVVFYWALQLQMPLFKWGV